MSEWNEIFGKGLGNLALSRIDEKSELNDLDGRLGQNFALLSSSILRRWNETGAWPSPDSEDIGTIFIVSEQVTALVIVERDKAAIVMTSGLARRLVRFAALYCASWRRNEVEVNDECYEDFLEEIWPSLASVWVEYGIDETYWSQAHNILLQMLEYIVQHELAHIDRGHIGKQAGTGERHQLSESEALMAHMAGNTAVRNREFEADVWAVQLHLEDFLEAADWAEKPRDVIFDYLRATVAAWIMVLMALDTDGKPVAGSKRSTHPAPVHRAMMMDEAFLDGIGHAFGYGRDDIRDFLDEVWVTVSGVAQRAGLTKGRWWGDDTRRMGQLEFRRIQEKFLAYFSSRPRPVRFSDDSIS